MTGRRQERHGFVRDRGLQLERTTLAWSRTALALAATCLLAARGPTLRSGPWIAVVATVAGLTAGLAMLAAAHRRYRYWARGGGPPLRPGVANTALAIATSGLGVAVLVAAVLGHR